VSLLLAAFPTRTAIGIIVVLGAATGLLCAALYAARCIGAL
jgi:hypothetical protein